MRMRTVSSQVHDLSHQLHPSQLIHLGLVAASRSLCKEVSQASGIQIDFSHSDVPNSIPQDTSVCLYRVLQESLTNMVKHSGTRAARSSWLENPGKSAYPYPTPAKASIPKLPRAAEMAPDWV